MSDAAPPTGPHDPDGAPPTTGPTDPTVPVSPVSPVDPTATFGAPSGDPTAPAGTGPSAPWGQAPAAAPGPGGPYGQGWADDGTYLPPPAPAPPAPPVGAPVPGYGAPQGPGYGPPQGPGYGGGGYPPVPPGGLAPLGWVATPWGPRWRGPIGTPKSAGVTILLSIVTCGIWTYVWSYQTHEDLKRYRGDGLGGAVGLVLAIVVSVAVMFTAPMEIEQMYQEEGLESPVKTMDGLWFLLPIVGNFIWYFKVQNALNDFWVARGATPA